MHAFASNGREDVRLASVKALGEPWSADALARLAGLSPGLSTRLGAALRHTGALLRAARVQRRLVLVLTDGAPFDVDTPDPADLAEDARHAVLGLKRAGRRGLRHGAGGAGHGGGRGDLRPPPAAWRCRAWTCPAGAAVADVRAADPGLTPARASLDQPSLAQPSLAQRCSVASFGMPSIGHSSVPTVGRVIASTISRVASGSAIHFL